MNNVDLMEANLNKADLHGANLNNAKLFGAKLNNVDLMEADVDRAHLSYADVTGAIYAPVSPPPDPYVAGIKGLQTVTFPQGEKIGLVQLRELIQKAGLRDLEREATYAIERGRTRHALVEWKKNSVHAAEGAFRFVFFEATTAYGLPGPSADHDRYALGSADFSLRLAHPPPIKADQSERNVSVATNGHDERNLPDLAKRSH